MMYALLALLWLVTGSIMIHSFRKTSYGSYYRFYPLIILTSPFLMLAWALESIIPELNVEGAALILIYFIAGVMS